MKLYFAPLEGIAGYVFRNAFQDAFNPEIDKYFSPFISPGVNQPLTPKELRDIAPEHNKGMYLVPQILANNADDFLLAASYIKDLGYKEINLNLGCPSGTVVSKKKGAGLLAEPDMLEQMLDKIYATTDMKVSLKTRIGKESPEEFPALLDIYSKFPVEELIIHPRVRSDYYNNTPNMEAFSSAVEKLSGKISICYNGDVLTKEDYFRIANGNAQQIHEDNMLQFEFTNKAVKIDAIMIGRGFLRNPLLANDIKKVSEKEAIINNKDIRSKRIDSEEISSEDMKKLKMFHDLLLEGYIEIMSGERPVLFKMKELWFYMIDSFPGNEKLAKKIKKAEKLSAYKEIVKEFFE